MVKKYDLEGARRKLSCACSSLLLGFGDTKRRFEEARDENTDAIKYIEKAISQHKGNEQAETYSEWQDLLCEASFGKGLADGLLEMKEKTYKNRHRSLQELESVVKEFNNAYSELAREPKLPENHLMVGNGFGRLGLAKEGQNMLESETYWDKMDDYLSTK
jgi:hypothetical protein